MSSSSSSDKITGPDGPPTLLVERPVLALPAKRDIGGYCPPEDQGTVARLRNTVARKAQCSGACLKEAVTRRIPILEWLPRYNFKENILGDTIAGITVAILQIPQGMGFALLANIPAICGIYMAFFPVIAYAVLATSQHNSMGSFAVITLMTGKVVNQYATFPDDSNAAAGNSSVAALDNLASGDPTYTPIEVATIVCFMVGFWSVLLGFLSMGSLTVFFNDMLVSGFSTGAAVHVVTSQIKDLLGISVQSFSGPLKIIYSYIDIFSKLTSSNVATVIISAISITVLSLNNELLKPRLSKVTKIPMPIELIVVIVGTTTCYLANFPFDYNVQIVGEIPTGLPPPALPPFSLAGSVAVDSLVIAIVAYAGSYSLARIFAIKHDYEVDANQELYAMGWGNMFSSFFSCAPMASAIARVLIQDAVGGVTQLACLITAFAILWVLLFIGPVFEFLPKACLASIIVVALKGMFMQVFDMMRMWKVSRVDAMLWIVTFLAVVIIDVDYGLLLGVLVAISVLVVRGQKPQMAKLGRVPNSDLYLESKLYGQACDLPGMVVIRIRGALHFANRDNFRASLNKASGFDPIAMKKAKLAAEKDDLGKGDAKKVRHLLLDCQGLSSCDASGSKFITRLNTMYEAAGVVLCFAGLNEEVLRSFEVMGTLAAVTEERIFHTVHDAVTVLQRDDPNVMQLDVATTDF